ncbi:MAG: hypothetical protein KDD11_21075 [Acidobacteria bacterium]|nr:hypothetical protein [Acidobacteriota bacterium]
MSQTLGSPAETSDTLKNQFEKRSGPCWLSIMELGIDQWYGRQRTRAHLMSPSRSQQAAPRPIPEVEARIPRAQPIGGEGRARRPTYRALFLALLFASVAGCVRTEERSAEPRPSFRETTKQVAAEHEGLCPNADRVYLVELLVYKNLLVRPPHLPSEAEFVGEGRLRAYLIGELPEELLDELEFEEPWDGSTMTSFNLHQLEELCRLSQLEIRNPAFYEFDHHESD